MASPGYASPHGGYINSPGYGSPTSPGYVGSRIKQQSPIYNNMVSPIYNATGAGNSPTIIQSPTYNQRGAIQAQSPNYSPTSRQSPYNSGVGAGGQSGQYMVKSNYSPSYSPSANAPSPASPNYSPTILP